MQKLQFGAGTVIALLVVLAAVLGGAATAAAAEPTQATIQEVATFAGGHQGPVGSFAASGIPGCATGSFTDQVVSFNPSGTRIVLDRTYVCADGDTFTARVALHLSTIDPAGTQTADGTWRIVAATGGLAALSGSGSTTGLNSGCSPVGTAFGECTTGAGTTTVAVH
jgi:hypothetical protein